MKKIFNTDVADFLEKNVGNIVSDKIEIKQNGSWKEIKKMYEKLISEQIFSDEEDYEDEEFQKIWNEIVEEKHFERACLIEMVMEFTRLRYVYYSSKKNSKIYFNRDEEEFKTKIVVDNSYPGGHIVEKTKEEAEEDYNDYIRYMNYVLDLVNGYDENELEDCDEEEEIEDEENIFIKDRIFGKKDGAHHILLPIKGKILDKRVMRISKLMKDNNFYLPVDFTKFLKFSMEEKVRNNPTYEYIVEDVYASFVAAILEDDDVYQYFHISKLSDKEEKRANGYRNKTIQIANQIYDKFCDFISGETNSKLYAKIWGEELCCFSVSNELFLFLNELFSIFSCNYRDIVINNEGDKESLDEDTQTFFCYLDSIIENLISIHSQYMRIVVIRTMIKEGEKAVLEIHARSNECKQRVLAFLCKCSEFLVQIVCNKTTNINNRFHARLRLMGYLTYKAKSNLHSDENGIEQEIAILSEMLEKMMQQDSYWGISNEKWEYICDETKGRKKGKVLYDKIIRGIIRCNFENNCQNICLARRSNELFPKEILQKVFSKTDKEKNRVVAKYVIDGNVFGLQSIYKVKNKERHLVVRGVRWIENRVELVECSYIEMLKSDAELIQDNVDTH